MQISPGLNERLQMNLRNMRGEPSYRFVRQLIVAESAKDEPDFAGLKAFILEAIGLNLDYEIEGAKTRRAAEMKAP